MNKVYKPVDNIAYRNPNNKSVFLAGSIEMGNAVDWQTDLSNFFIERGYDVFNPRREDWDSSWTQDFNTPQFSQQVNWELNALEQVDEIVMYLDPNTKSPISLLELGRFGGCNMHVVCPDGFWRKGNVDIFCNRYGIKLYKTLDDLKERMAKSFY